MKAISALSCEKASLWLRAFKSLPEDEIRMVGVAGALKKLGGFTGLADKHAAQKRGAAKRAQAADQHGNLQARLGRRIGDDLGWFPFLQVEGDIADSKQTFGGVNGWIFFKNASDAAVDFVRYYSQPETW